MTKFNETLQPLWDEVDAMDMEVLQIMARRDAIRRKLTAFKMQNNIPAEIEGRREKILANIDRIAEELELDRTFAKRLYEVVISHSLDYEHRIRNEEDM